MYHTLWKSLLGLTTACALFLSGACPALADDSSQTVSDEEKVASAFNLSLKDSHYADSTARALVEKEIGLSGSQVDALLVDKVPLSLNLYNSSQSVSDEILFGLSERDVEIVGTLPTVDDETGEVSIPNPETREMFSMRAKDHVVTKVTDGVARTQDTNTQPGEIAVSHVTANESGQIVGVIKDRSSSFMDFSYALPDGYKLEPRSDGGFALLSNSGSIEGEINAPWAIDANGKQLPTSFELIDSTTLRQHVTTEDAAFPITLDPSWSWWLVTAGKCAISVAPLLVTGGAALASRVPKLISFINKLSKTPKIAAAISKVGGVKNAAVAAVKKAVIVLRSKLSKGIADKLPSPSLTSAEKVFIAAAWPFIVDNFWDLIGIGSCSSLVTGG